MFRIYSFLKKITFCVCLPRSGENDVDFVGNLETEEGELPDDLAGATGIFLTPVTTYFLCYITEPSTSAQ